MIKYMKTVASLVVFGVALEIAAPVAWSKDLKSETVLGNPVPCTANSNDWKNGVRSSIACPKGSVISGGGCDFTCLGMTHAISHPTANGWECGMITRAQVDKNDPRAADDAASGRTFTAYAVCLSM